jgi:propanol-preferring alcohol dehydrogenase
LDYQRHRFYEKRLTSVTANTRSDGAELLRLATALELSAQVTSYPFSEADRALDDVATGHLTGVAVLEMA